ncbi:MAG: hypothetical protein A2666_04525 [Parcubacteria group bacterium RIFCSPHIGHO2_01_FULL_47_10b]|nr:MAG: hypothetical protein A2666_04525 [Parcubacteria group bacterium RIFCSPHIGHO2_01_FULL_47_10b]
MIIRAQRWETATPNGTLYAADLKLTAETPADQVILGQMQASGLPIADRFDALSQADGEALFRNAIRELETLYRPFAGTYRHWTDTIDIEI